MIKNTSQIGKEKMKRTVKISFVVVFVLFFIGIKTLKLPTWKTEGTKWHYTSKEPVKSNWVTYNKKVYLVNNQRQMINNWQEVDGNWYYLEGWHGLKTGWFPSNGKMFYLDEKTGKMAIGKTVIEGKDYQFDENGALVGYKEEVLEEENGKN